MANHRKGGLRSSLCHRKTAESLLNYKIQRWGILKCQMNPDNIVLGGIVCSTKLPYPGAEERPRILLPTGYCCEIMKRAHKEVGHCAVHRTLQRVARDA